MHIVYKMVALFAFFRRNYEKYNFLNTGMIKKLPKKGLKSNFLKQWIFYAYRFLFNKL